MQVKKKLIFIWLDVCINEMCVKLIIIFLSSFYYSWNYYIIYLWVFRFKLTFDRTSSESGVFLIYSTGRRKILRHQRQVHMGLEMTSHPPVSFQQDTWSVRLTCAKPFYTLIASLPLMLRNRLLFFDYFELDAKQSQFRVKYFLKSILKNKNEINQVS